MIVKTDAAPLKALTSDICWMDSTPLVSGKTYKLQHGINESKVKVTGINYRVDTSRLLKEETVSELGLNDIGEISLRSAKPILADTYEENRSNGAFILVDEFTNNTVGVGFVK